LNRETDIRLTLTERNTLLKNVAPDLCICIHHNSNSDPARDGFSSWYYTPFSRDAAEAVYEASKNSGIYTNSTMNWYYYYVSRQTVCPIVLTENGYLSNRKDANKIGDRESNLRKAKDLTQGIVDYYLSQNT
jgi:N-acetylmuramoyl-L-alanine amidase